MATVIELGMAKEFSQDEICLILPVINRITRRYKTDVDVLLNRLEVISTNQEDRVFELEKQIDIFISEWKQKMKKLGAKPKGLWSVDFDSGKGYFCWKFPEIEVLKHHLYADACSKRTLLNTEIKATYLEARAERD